MIEILKEDWNDQDRKRVVPVKIYSPREGNGPFPVILFSHGLGSSRDVYGYLGRHWAAHEYVSVHLQHAGTDAAVWEKAPVVQRMDLLRRAASLPENFRNRPKDVSFAIDTLTHLQQTDAVWERRIDLDRIGVAGHSFGAFTALACIGEQFFTPDGDAISFHDSRIKAAIAMSPPVFPEAAQMKAAYAQIRVPCLHMAGTADDSPIGETTAAQRRIPYDQIRASGQYFLNFNRADHFIFSGRWPGQTGGENDKMFQEQILSSSTAFWHAYLKNQKTAREWLVREFPTNLGEQGTLESK